MIVPDTSVWVAAFRAPATHEAITLRALLEADEVALALPVRIELMSGVAAKDRKALARALSSLPVMYPSDETWQAIRGWVPHAADMGLHFSVSDLLIAALATELGALVWSLDKHFMKMETLNFVQLYAP